MRYVTFLTVICVLLSFQFLPAQAPELLWSREYGDGVGYCVIETFDSCYVIVGYSDYDNGGDLRLLKTNSDGDTIWTKTYGDTNYNDFGYSIRETSDHGFIIVGSTASLGAGDQDVWLLRTDEFGDTLWTKTFGGDSSDVGKCIQITNDGGYIIVGSTKSFGAGGEDVLLIKTDSNGNTLWTKTYGDSLNDWGNYIIQTSDSGFALVGGVNWEEPYWIGTPSCWFIKTNTNGDSLFGEAIYPIVPGYIFGQCVLETTDGYLCCGEHELGFGSYGFLTKIDFNGDTLWYDLGGGPQRSICNTFDGFYLIPWDDRSNTGGYTAAGLVLYNGNGQVIWDLLIFSTNAYVHFHIRSVIQTYDSSFVITGDDEDRIFIKKFGTPTSGLRIDEEIVSRSFSLSQNYRNPFNPSTTIEFDLPKSSEVTLKVFNILGEEVATLVSDRLSAGSYSYEWNASNLASGVYLYRLEAEGFVQTRKMILMK